MRHFCLAVILIATCANTSVCRAEIVKSGGSSAGLARAATFVRAATGTTPSTLGVVIYSGHGPAFNGGLIKCHTLNSIIIFYGGAWPKNTAGQQIVTDFIQSLSGSPYINILGDYTSGLCNDPARKIAVQKIDFDSGSLGTSVSIAALGDVIHQRVDSHQYPPGTSAFFVIASPDVSANYNGQYSCNSSLAGGSSSCFCGLHTWRDQVNAGQIKFSYAFISTGSPLCQAQLTSSPNSDVNADGAVNTIAHELAEIVTDSYQGTFNGGLIASGYYDTNDGSEIGDMCNFYFPGIFAASNGSLANVRIGARNYLIQALWKRNHGCAMN